MCVVCSCSFDFAGSGGFDFALGCAVRMLDMLSLPEDGGTKEQRGEKSCGACVRV
jgi:hypothetical protein